MILKNVLRLKLGNIGFFKLCAQTSKIIMWSCDILHPSKSFITRPAKWRLSVVDVFLLTHGNDYRKIMQPVRIMGRVIIRKWLRNNFNQFSCLLSNVVPIKYTNTGHILTRCHSSTEWMKCKYECFNTWLEERNWLRYH